MLQSDHFPPKHLKKLTRQVNNWLGDMIQSDQLRLNYPRNSKSATINASFELGENFLMACLSDKEIFDDKSLDRDLGDLVKLTGRRHHQLKHQLIRGKRAFAYARTVVARNETLCQLFATNLAPKIQDAIRWLDRHEKDEFAEGTWRVRLVTVPTFHTHAFLIQQLENGKVVSTGESKILVIKTTEWMDELSYEQLFTTENFLQAFKKQTPILGVLGNINVTEREARV